MKKLSIVGKGYHTEENVVGYCTTGDRVKYWGMLLIELIGANGTPVELATAFLNKFHEEPVILTGFIAAVHFGSVAIENKSQWHPDF